MFSNCKKEKKIEYIQKCIFKFCNYINETSSSELEYLLGSFLLLLLNLFVKFLFESVFAVFPIFISFLLLVHIQDIIEVCTFS